MTGARSKPERRKPGRGEAQSEVAYAVGVAEKSNPAKVRAIANGKSDGDGAEGPTVQQLAADAAEFEKFWAEREVLEHVRSFARSRLVSPWGMLGAVLTRTLCAVGPHVVLPPLVGSHGSLNLFLAVVGPSGAGKDAANAAARDAIDLGLVTPQHEAAPGSGEGIARAYVYRDSGVLVTARTSVLFLTNEVDGLTAVGQRAGATLMPELRKAYMGDQLGFQYADKNKRLPVEAHSYRMGLIVGVQPGRAGFLLDDSDAGTPQRFLWLPLSDPELPEDDDDEAAALAPLRWKRPDFAQDPPDALLGLHGDRVVMDVAPSIRKRIRDTRRAVLRGQDPQAALDAHGNLAQLKVAAAFALLDGSQDVGESDWHLAGVLRKKSDETRAGVEAQLWKARSATNRARGKAEGERAVILSETVEAHAAATLTKWVLGRLTATEWTSHAALLRALDSRRREHLGAALELLIASGQVEVQKFEYQGQHGRKYRRAAE